MNTTNTSNNLITGSATANYYVRSCKKLLARIEQAKNSILNEFHVTLEPHHKSYQLALNEAEALAWQTAYPHLLFPSLAVEKIQSVSAWQMRQRLVHQQHLAFAEAA
jgi:hypothetical protein